MILAFYMSSALYNPANNVIERYTRIGITLSVHMSCYRNSSLTDEPILMILYTVEVHNLRLCIKEDKPGTNYLKGDEFKGDN